MESLQKKYSTTEVIGVIISNEIIQLKKNKNERKCSILVDKHPYV